jgi:hypothetical protein
MELYTDSDSPTLDRGVERRLHQIDRGLKVTWSKWAIDLAPDLEDHTRNPNFSFPICDRKGNPIPAARPKFVLWSRDEVGCYHMIGEWSAFDHRQIRWLEENAWDVQNRPLGEQLRINRVKDEERREAALASAADDKQHWVRENKKRIEDSIEWGKHHRKGAKVFSSGYVKYRGSATEDMPRSAKEDGWTPAPTGGNEE